MDCKRVTVIGIGPVISTRKKSTTQECVVLFLFYLPFTLTTPFVKNAFGALRRVRQTQNINNLSSDHGQSRAETISNRFAQKRFALVVRGILCYA